MTASTHTTSPQKQVPRHTTLRTTSGRNASSVPTLAQHALAGEGRMRSFVQIQTNIAGLILFLGIIITCHCAAYPSKHNTNTWEPKPPVSKKPDPSLYTRKFSEQTFIGTHDAAAIRNKDNNWSLSGNQYFNLSVQLASGVRFIQAQGHRDPNGTSQIRLCHFNCALLDAGSLDEYLLTAKAWLEKNPTEFITFLFVSAGPSLAQWAQAYYRTGFDLISFVPPKRGNMDVDDWPTIEEMVRSGKRAVTFLSSQANEELVPYLLHEWSYIFETNYVNDHPSQFSCIPSRYQPPSLFWTSPDTAPLPPRNRLSLVNHFLYASLFGFRYPNASYVAHTNAAGFEQGMLGEHVVRCRERYGGRRPNFVLVDFWNEGDVWSVENGINQE